MDQFIQTVKEHEGYSSCVYQDSLGYFTIGYGKMVDKRKNGGLTESQASYILNDELQSARASLQSFQWFNAMDEVRQDVIVELCFNIGLQGVLKFHNMIAAITAKDYATASNCLLDSLWCRQVGTTRSDNMALRLKDGFYASF